MKPLVKLIIVEFSCIILGCILGLILIIQYPLLLEGDSVLANIIATVSTFGIGDYILLVLSVGLIFTGAALPAFYIIVSAIKGPPAGNKTPNQSYNRQ
jgi:hypothetical protein